MFLFKSIVDEAPDLPDVPYGVHDVSRCHSCVVAAEYEDAAFHQMLWGCGEDGVKLWWSNVGFCEGFVKRVQNDVDDIGK